MPIRLHSHLRSPPGEFFIRIVARDGQWRVTGSAADHANGVYQFGPWPTVDLVAKDMVAFLKGNGYAERDWAGCVAAIDAYTCQRLGNSPKWCYDSEHKVAETSPTARRGKGCAGCGVQLP